MENNLVQVGGRKLAENMKRYTRREVSISLGMLLGAVVDF